MKILKTIISAITKMATKPVVEQIYSCNCSDETVFHNVIIHESFNDTQPKPARLCMFHITNETYKGNIISMVEHETT